MDAKDIALAAGVVVTLVLGIWNLTANYRTSKRTSFINTVTSQRVQWIELLRQDIAAFCGLTYTWCSSELEGKASELDVVKDIDRLRHLILLRLNPDGVHDKAIEKLVTEIPNCRRRSKIDPPCRSKLTRGRTPILC